MTCVYLKPEVKKKKDTTAMTAATNDAWIGPLDESCYVRGK